VNWQVRTSTIVSDDKPDSYEQHSVITKQYLSTAMLYIIIIIINICPLSCLHSQASITSG